MWHFYTNQFVVYDIHGETVLDKDSILWGHKQWNHHQLNLKYQILHKLHLIINIVMPKGEVLNTEPTSGIENNFGSVESNILVSNLLDLFHKLFSLLFLFFYIMGLSNPYHSDSLWITPENSLSHQLSKQNQKIYELGDHYVPTSTKWSGDIWPLVSNMFTHIGLNQLFTFLTNMISIITTQHVINT